MLHAISHDLITADSLFEPPRQTRSGQHFVGTQHPFSNRDVLWAATCARSVTVDAGRGIDAQTGVALHGLFLIAVVFKVHSMAQYVMDWHVAGTRT